MLGLARILGLVLVRLRCIAAANVLPVLDFFTGTLTLLNHGYTLALGSDIWIRLYILATLDGTDWVIPILNTPHAILTTLYPYEQADGLGLVAALAEELIS